MRAAWSLAQHRSSRDSTTARAEIGNALILYWNNARCEAQRAGRSFKQRMAITWLNQSRWRDERRVMPQRRHNPEKVRAILYAVIRELPDDMTVAELRDELEITSVQGGM